MSASEFINRDAVDYTLFGHSVEDIVNYNEALVLDAIRELYERDTSLCRCAVCVEDLYALSLNSLPARYIQSTSVRQYVGSPRYIGPDEVRARVAEAAEKVLRNAHH